MAREQYHPSEELAARATAAAQACTHVPVKHTRLANALADVLDLPDLELVTNRDHYASAPGRLLDESGATVATDWRTWMAEQLASENGEAVAVWEKYREKAWTTTEWRLDLLYLTGQSGSRAWDFQQVEVWAEQEYMSRRLFSPERWNKPGSSDRLVDGDCAGAAVENPAALGPLRYRLQAIVDFGRFVDRGAALWQDMCTSNANRVVTITADGGPSQTGRMRERIPEAQATTWNGLRWFNDWAYSSAGRERGGVWRFWAFQTSAWDLNGRSGLSLVPVWGHRAKVAKVEGHKLNDHELYGRLLKLSDRTGKVPFNYFFYGLHGSLVSHGSLERVLKMANQGEIVLAEHDYQVLTAWAASPYGF